MRIIAHKVGNKITGDGCSFSDDELQLDENLSDMLQNYFLGAFKTEETYHFYSDSYLSNNLAYTITKLIFENQKTFVEDSKNLARLLYIAAENPRIQGGELFVVYFPKNESNEIEKIGIFKTEKRESFLKINDSLAVETDKGISLARIDKAALIYNTEKDNGYILQVVDNNKNGDLYYWFEDFLKVKQRTDEYFHTIMDEKEQKIHTIRKDEKNRWKPGMMIDFFINARQKDMFRFAPRIQVVSIQQVLMSNSANGFKVSVDGFLLEQEEIKQLAINDGFDNVEDFQDYFINEADDDMGGVFYKGKIIHWTDFKY